VNNALCAETSKLNYDRLQFSSELPNTDYHFAVGDATAWSGIKRAGNAFIMGQFVATNLMRHILAAENLNADFDLLNCPEMDPMMALSVGSKALVYQEAIGVLASEELKETVIGRGMGIDGTLSRN
jgi:hypothetical protein